MCDADGSGAIDLDEFQVAMYTIDPVSGNTVGFSPNRLLSPQDAFDMFDEVRPSTQKKGGGGGGRKQFS